MEHFWAAQSVLSGKDDLKELRLIRWDRLVEWSPWNCILLSKDEAKIHLQLPFPEDVMPIS